MLLLLDLCLTLIALVHLSLHCASCRSGDVFSGLVLVDASVSRPNALDRLWLRFHRFLLRTVGHNPISTGTSGASVLFVVESKGAKLQSQQLLVATTKMYIYICVVACIHRRLLVTTFRLAMHVFLLWPPPGFFANVCFSRAIAGTSSPMMVAFRRNLTRVPPKVRTTTTCRQQLLCFIGVT